MTKDEVLKLALEALKHLMENKSLHYTYKDKAEKAITACEQALAEPAQERNFCPRCGKRTADLTVIHTCTPPQDKNT